MHKPIYITLTNPLHASCVPCQAGCQIQRACSAYRQQGSPSQQPICCAVWASQLQDCGFTLQLCTRAHVEWRCRRSCKAPGVLCPAAWLKKSGPLPLLASNECGPKTHQPWILAATNTPHSQALGWLMPQAVQLQFSISSRMATCQYQQQRRLTTAAGSPPPACLQQYSCSRAVWPACSRCWTR